MALLRNLLAAVVATTCSLAMLSACGSDDSDTNDESTSTSTTTETSTANTDDELATAPLSMEYFGSTEEEAQKSAAGVLASERDYAGSLYTYNGLRALFPDLPDPAGFVFREEASHLINALLWTSEEAVESGAANTMIDNISVVAFEFDDAVSKEQLRSAVDAELTRMGADAAPVELDEATGYQVTARDTSNELPVALQGYYWLGADSKTLYQVVIALVEEDTVPQALDGWAQDVIAETDAAD